jgi:hypothetical protein
MRRIGLAVVLAGSLALVPLANEAQQAGKIWRIGLFQGVDVGGTVNDVLQALNR